MSLISRHSADDMHTVATETKSQFVQSREQKRCRKGPLFEAGQTVMHMSALAIPPAVLQWAFFVYLSPA